jgi:hypothetical protein
LKCGGRKIPTQPKKTEQCNKHLTQKNAQSHLHALFFSTLNSCVYEGKKRGPKTKQTDQKTVPNSLPYRQQQFQSRARKLGLKYGKYKPN